MEVKLGQKVRDTVTGFEGIAICRSLWLNGCARIIIQPPVDKDGKIPSTECVDETQLEILEQEKPRTVNRATGGPQNDAAVKPY